ncbi:MAG: hypothetical protein AAGK21_11475 [Bacteroidota bacterium]
MFNRIALFALALALPLAACGSETTEADDTDVTIETEDVDAAMDDAAEGAEEAMEDVDAAMDDAAEGAEEVMDDAAEGAEEVMDDADAAMEDAEADMEGDGDGM